MVLSKGEKVMRNELLVALFIAVFAVAGWAAVWNGEKYINWYTEHELESIYTISTAEQLAGFADLVNSGTDFEGKTIILSADIALNDIDSDPLLSWPGIGVFVTGAQKSFKGTFDGGGHVISGIHNDKGLFGYVENGTIKNIGVVASSISGKLNGQYPIGGLVTRNKGRIINCYSLASVGNNPITGGLVGRNFCGAEISNSYSAGTVTCKSQSGVCHFGGLVGDDSNETGCENPPKIVNSYHNGYDNSYGTKTDEMQSEAFVDLLNNFLNDVVVPEFPAVMNKWTYTPNEYPKFSTATVSAFPGDGTETNPYTISTKKQLENFSRISIKKSFEDQYIKLGDDIVLNDTMNWESWSNDNQPDYEWIPIESFKGIFDGDGHIISGVYVNSPDDDSGLFKSLGNNGIIKNLGMVAFYINGNEYVGGLVGKSEGREIINSYAIGSVRGYTYAGGLAGWNNNTTGITNSYFVGSVGGDGIYSQYSGLANPLNSTFFDNIITNSYYDREVMGERLDDYDAYGKITRAMKSKSTYESGNWDLKDIWELDNSINNGYPYLRVPVKNIVSTIDATYNIPADLNVTVQPNRARQKTITWTVDNDKAEISEGKITFKTAGNVTIKATITNGLSVSKNYDTTFSINVKKATPPTPTTPTNLTAIYGQTLADVTPSLNGGLSWVTPTQPVGNAGKQMHNAQFTPSDVNNYNVLPLSLEVEVKKAQPSYTKPSNLTAAYGQTLSQVSLSGGWSWMDITKNVGNPGKQSFDAQFTPSDINNYEIIPNISLEITVNPAQYCVFTKGKACLSGSYNVCQAGGKLSNTCPYLNNIVTPITLQQILSSNIQIQTTPTAILLSNLPPNAKIEAYNLQGKRIYSAHPENPKILRIGVQTKGMYIVKVNDNILRVLVM